MAVELLCKHCGAEYSVKASKATKSKYCSAKCHYAAARADVADRFWSHVKKTDGCWLWQLACDDDGYGAFKITGKSNRAPRVAWELTNGEIPEGMVVRHKCDNPPCVRPDHLELGTDLDNAGDREARGRTYAGEGHHFARLTEADVIDIRTVYVFGGNVSDIARAYGIHRSAVASLITGRTWARAGGHISKMPSREEWLAKAQGKGATTCAA